MYDIVFVLSTALIGFIFSYIVVTAFNIGGQSDPALGRDLHQIGLQMSAIAVSTIFIPARGSWSLGSDMATTIASRWKWVIGLALFTVATFMMHYYHYELLSIMDDGWTCTIVPILRNIVMPLLQISRVLFALVTPLVNGYLVIMGQILNAWYITLARCSLGNLFKIFTELTQAMIAMAISIRNWFGVDSVVTDSNNFFFNDFDIEKPINHTMKAVVVSQEVLSCACKRFEPLFELGFVIFKEPLVVAVLNSGFQAFIRAFQFSFKLLYPELFPDVYAISFKLEERIMNAGLAGDAILFKLMRQMVKMFDKDFEFTVYPKESVASVGAHMAVAGTHAFTTLAANVPLHVMGSFKSGITPFDPEVWSLEKSFSHIHRAIYSTSVLIQWAVYVLERMLTDTNNVQAVFTSSTTPLELTCDWARDVEDHKIVSVGYTAGCSFYYGSITFVNLYYIAYGLSIELLTKTLFTREPQNIFRTFQRWEGPMLPRNKVYTCEDRKEATAYNYETDVYYKEGWIWTQDRGKCQCNRYYGTTAKEDQAPYNPWCGQPSLNFDVFASLDALVMHVSHGVLGPGFGDAFPFIDPIQNIEINIPQMGMEKSIALPFALPPVTRTAIESVRVLTRIVLSFGDIVTGHFFNFPTNCGHGLNMLQLQKQYESLTKQSSYGLKDDQMRWRTCSQREYHDSEGDTRTPICDKSNDNSDCMCSYLQPLNTQSKCMCIARYPDLDITSSNQEVGDLIEKRFTSENVAIHWCNSMIVEWTFQNTAAFADALDYIVSLGPLNPTCDVIDRIIEGGSLETDEPDQRSSSTYLIADTPTLNITQEFQSADAKLNNLKELYSNARTGCTIKPGGEVDATDEFGNPVYNADGSVVKVMTQPEWSCDASRAYEAISEFDPLQPNPVNPSDQIGCRIWGRYDFFCSSGLFVRNFKRLSMNMARQVINDGIAVMAGNFKDINLDTLPRLCDYERIFGAISAMIAGIIPKISLELKKAFAGYINMVLQMVFVQTVRTVLTLTNMATSIIMSVLDGTIDRSSLTNTFEKGIETIVTGLTWAFKYFWGTTGDILNTLSPGSGDICTTIVDITNIVEAQLKKDLLDLVGLGLKVFFQFIAALNGDTSIIDDMFKNAFELWAKIQLLLIRQMWQIFYKITDFFGPIGEFFKLLISTVCTAINFVFSTIDSIVKGLTFGQADIGWKPMQCTELKATHGNHTRGHLGKHFLRSADNEDITSRVANALDWNGTTVCDHFMTAAADYSYTELRPLEKAKWFECMELKLIGVQMADFVQSKSFPTDIMYNWKRKYQLGYEFMQALQVVLKHVVAVEPLRWSQVRLDLKHIGLDADMYIRLFQKTSSFANEILHNVEMTNFVRFLFEHIDPDFENGANPSSVATAWHVYQDLGDVYTKTTEEWKRRDGTQQMWKAVDASMDMHTHLHTWWSAVGTENTPDTTHTERVIHSLKSRLKHTFHETSRKTARHTKPMTAWLKTPMRTYNKTCSQRGDPGWCTDCNILDNLIETTLEQTDAIADFYATRFPVILNNVSAYFNELGDYNEAFFEGVFSRLQSSAPQPQQPDIRYTYHVANDWRDLGESFWDFFTDIGNTDKRDAWLAQIDKVLVATRKFVTVTDDTYVPFFGYSFYYSFDYLFFSKCNLHESVFVTTTTQETRIERIDTALLAIAVTTLVIVTNTAWSLFPLVWLANTVVIAALSSGIFLYIVYGYHLNCLPCIPYTLMDDLNEWYVSRIQPGCFYKMLPYLVYEASDDTCLTCSTPHQYRNCNEYTVANYTEGMLPLNELIEEYNIFWGGLFWVRWQLPDVPIFLVKYGLVPFESVLGQLALGAWQGVPVDPIWIDCFYAMWLDNILAAMAILVVGYVSVKIAVFSVQFIVQCAILVWYTYTALGYMSLTIEQSVVIE